MSSVNWMLLVRGWRDVGEDESNPGDSDMVKKPDRVRPVEDDAVARVGPGWIWIFPTQVYMPTLGNIGPRRVWISKSSARQGIGYPPSRAEIQRYGHNANARRVKRIGPPPPLSKSFAEAVKANEMVRRESDQRTWKRHPDDWMEEDDLMGGDVCHEQDLRHKLQRGLDEEGKDREY